MLYRITSRKESDNSQENVCKKAAFVNKGEAFTINGLHNANFLDLFEIFRTLIFKTHFENFSGYPHSTM